MFRILRGIAYSLASAGALFAIFFSALLVIQSAFAQAAQPTAPRPTILLVGDSLSAEYGLARGTGWYPLLEKALLQEKMGAKVSDTSPKQASLINASISGETSIGGTTRIAKLLKEHHPNLVILELGGNDALRGLPLSQTEANLTKIVKAAKAAHAKVLLIGIQVPPNYGADYQARFTRVFERVAKAENVPLVPFLLAGVADAPNAAELFQADRIHPNAKAQARMMENVWVKLKPMLK